MYSDQTFIRIRLNIDCISIRKSCRPVCVCALEKDFSCDKSEFSTSEEEYLYIKKCILIKRKKM